jgi:hypothetical protein
VGQRDLHLLEAGLDGGVEHLVAHFDADAADQGFVDEDRGVELAAETA